MRTSNRNGRLIWKIFRVAVLSYIGLVVLLYFLQSKLVYHPTAELEAAPGDVGLSYKDVRLAAPDGSKLHGWYVPADNATAAVLFCHGNAGNISHRLQTLSQWNRLGASVLIFDYRGYGQSEGKCCEQGTYEDAAAAWQYLVDQCGFSPRQIIIHGRSLGGSVAANLAADLDDGRKPAGLIVESSLTSAADLGAEKFFFLPVRWLCRFGYDTVTAVGRAGCPVLVIHSREDDLIPFRHGRKIFDAASNPKRFVEISGGHNNGPWVSQPKYGRALEKFLETCTGG